MKRIASIVMTAMLLMLFSVSTVFATASDGFELVSSNPEEGYDKVQSTNVMIKLFFSKDVSAEDTQAINEDMIKFTDADGKAVEFKIYYDSKDASKISLLTSDDLTEATDYTVSISGDLQSDDGSVLGADKTLNFTTKGAESGVTYMLLMVAMIVVMVVMTFRDQKKNMEAEQAKNPMASIQTNPYKLAKEKNISVEEAVKLIEAEKAKAQKRAEKAAKKQQEAEAERRRNEKQKKPEKKVYKVKTKRITKMHK